MTYKPGDIIFVQKGKEKKSLAEVLLEGEYVYDPTREHYRNTRTVRWTELKVFGNILSSWR